MVYFFINLVILIILFADRMMQYSNMQQKITLKQVGSILLMLFFGVFIMSYQWIREYIKNKRLDNAYKNT